MVKRKIIIHKGYLTKAIKEWIKIFDIFVNNTFISIKSEKINDKDIFWGKSKIPITYFCNRYWNIKRDIVNIVRNIFELDGMFRNKLNVIPKIKK